MQKIVTFLWFDTQAEEAMHFYTSIFSPSTRGTIRRYGKGMPMQEGMVMTASFELFGQEFVALNGGPVFQFTPAVSFLVHCETQAELDGYWEKLTAGGTVQQCGWLKDKYGVSWQIVPKALTEMLADKDAGKVQRAVQAMMAMKKFDIAALQRAVSEPNSL